MQEVLKLLSKKHCKEILINLKNGSLNFNTIAKITNHHKGTATRLLKELVENELIIREVQQNAKRTVKYSLSEKGKRITENLIEFMNAVNQFFYN